MIWWYCMLCNSAINIYIWYNKTIINTNNTNKVLSFFYVFTNAYRSTFPVMHYTNTCMSRYSSPLIERSLSNIAELAFIIQLLNYFHYRKLLLNRRLLFLLMNFAEITCWCGLITGYQQFHVLEESIWTIFAIILYSKYLLNYNNNTIDNNFIKKLLINSLFIGYISYMIVFDVPSYLYKPIATKTTILQCEKYSTDYQLWKPTLIWQTGYFTFGSWISLLL